MMILSPHVADRHDSGRFAMRLGSAKVPTSFDPGLDPSDVRRSPCHTIGQARRQSTELARQANREPGGVHLTAVLLDGSDHGTRHGDG